jgi:SAM-dependent methyltransferase
MSKQADIVAKIINAVKENNLVKITFGAKRDKNQALQNVYVKPILIKNVLHLSFTYRNSTNDAVKNFTPENVGEQIINLLETNFYNIDIYTSQQTIYYSNNKDGIEKIKYKKIEDGIKPISLNHNQEKNRLIQADAFFLHALGITSAEGFVKKEMQHKYKQINKYVEIITGILKDVKKADKFSVVDMGSGKGYLTFALYHYLQNNIADLQIEGIEMRTDLIEKCNKVAVELKFNGLVFKEGTIQNANISNVDMLIALHACDTATDDAIAKGIKNNVPIIICAPCCHKQIRKAIAKENVLQDVTKHGILLERQAEMVTDSIRALILEAHGYKTSVFDFIEMEHTPKNVMIVGVKKLKQDDKIFSQKMQAVQDLKKIFGIDKHYLETILN